jgi:hypothetical protein
LFNLNHQPLNQHMRLPNAKNTPATTVPPVYDEFKKAIWNTVDTVGQKDVYNVSQWVKFIDRLEKNSSGPEHTRKFNLESPIGGSWNEYMFIVQIHKQE